MSETLVGQPLTGIAPSTSYWVGASRDELAQRVAERRHLQAVPGERDALYAPTVNVAPVSDKVLR